MRGEAVVRNSRIINEAALHHVPAHKPLTSPKNEQAKEFEFIAVGNPTFDEKEEEW